MKYFFTLSLIFALFIGCSDSEKSPQIPEENFSLATLTSTAIKDITVNSAVSGGSIANNGGASVTARGVVWSTSSMPTISDNRTTDGVGTGTFTSTMNDLESSTKYYVRSYATNSEGTAYGNEVSFETLNIPEPEPVAKIFEGDVVLTTQNEVDDFGVEGYIEVTGTFFISGESIESLTPLLSVKKVGKLRIEGTEKLINLEGLNNVTEVNGEMLIVDNLILENIGALNNINTINGWLGIISNNKISSIQGFDSLTTVEFIQINENESIKSVDAFNTVEEIESFVFSSNKQIEFIGGFANLKSINRLFIENNEGNFTVDAFHEIIEFTDSFLISQNAGLTEIIGFEKIEALSNFIRVIDCPELVLLKGFSSLETAQSIFINNCPKLSTLDAFRNLQLLNGTLNLSFLDLNNLANFNSLEEVGGLWIGSRLNGLQNFNDLSNLKTINGAMKIFNNDSLISLMGFDSLVNCSDIEVTGNQNLTDFCAIKPLLDLNSDIPYRISGNRFNPTISDIAAGNCSN